MKGVRWGHSTGLIPDGSTDRRSTVFMRDVRPHRRALADVRDAGSRSKAFDVGFPLESGHCAPTSLMPENDPMRTKHAA